MEPEIYTKMHKKMSGKLEAKFPATTPGCLRHGKSLSPPLRFLRSFFLTASRPGYITEEVISLQQKEKRRRKKERGKKIPKIESISQNFDFCARPSPNVVKRDSTGRKVSEVFCKCYNALFVSVKAGSEIVQNSLLSAASEGNDQ